MKIKIRGKVGKKIFLFLLLALILIFYSYLGFFIYFNHKIYPGIKIGEIPLGGKDPKNAYNLLSSKFQDRRQETLELSYRDQIFTLDLSQILPIIDLDKKLDQAYFFGRSKDFLKDFSDQLKTLLFGNNLAFEISYKYPEHLALQIGKINKKIQTEAVSAQIILEEKIMILPSETGQEIDEEILTSQIKDYLIFLGPKPNSLPIKIIQPKFATSDATNFLPMLKAIKISPLNLYYQNINLLIIDQPVLLSLLDFNKPQKDQPLDKDKLTAFLKTTSSQINQPVWEAKFIFDPKIKKVSQFQPAQEGRELDILKTVQILNQTLATSSASQSRTESKNIILPINITQPKITTSDVNNFGIREFLGQGTSSFSGSIENRIYNIKLAASKINGVLVSPQTTFSFNNTVGDISAESGYKQAYVIKSGRTVLDDGGGVCQVSTTLFRAVLNSGLPILRRTAHAYRVGYYEQNSPPGFDATVFAPSVDFQFKNNTPTHVLIQAYTLSNILYIDFYGALDGRIVSITIPKLTDQTPPPPEIRQDDPTLPRGTVKQVDWPAWGANVSFERIVKKNEEVLISETFRSAYKPWQAIYLVGTKD